jgi:hypothetical protein
MSSFAVRGGHRTFQILFIRAESGEAIAVTNPLITLFHYDDLDGVTGLNRIVDITPTPLIAMSIIGQYCYAWDVPVNKVMNQMHYARYTGTDPLYGKEINYEESFSITDEDIIQPRTQVCGRMTASFIRDL